MVGVHVSVAVAVKVAVGKTTGDGNSIGGALVKVIVGDGLEVAVGVG
jgi:hypothetical protein